MGATSERSASSRSIDHVIREIIPFRFLSSADRAAIGGLATERTIPARATIYETGDTDNEMFFLVSGLVETIDTSTDPEQRVNRIGSGNYFGERAAMFDIPREYTLRTVEESRVVALPGARFLDLVHSSRGFAQALGSILREKQGIFDAFDRFTAELMRGIALGSIDIRELLPLYRVLEPALHPGANSDAIDFPALTYAVSRLPENVTRTFVYLVTDDLPFEFSTPDRMFQAIPTRSRRRNVWEMLPGKSMVLLRNGVSDLFDFVTCLCLYAVETWKIRQRIADPGTILAIESALAEDSVGAGFLDSLPFTTPERDGLASIWPAETLTRLHQITLHREAMHIDIRRQTHAYSSRRTDVWTNQISTATRELLGCDPGDLDPEYPVHVISSNTHSVTNCLNPFLAEHVPEILDWADDSGHSTSGQRWRNEIDRAYASSRDFIQANPGRYAEADMDWGMIRLRETVSTGIEVQLIDLSRLAGYTVDADIGPVPGRPALIVNIDYAFGEQAEEIIRNLILLFGRRLASINVLGKAGALTGSRGEILVPTAFIEQSSDRFYPLDSISEVETNALEARASGLAIHAGPLLTVSGTLLQNNTMLHFYRHIWDCVGLEMEGTHYYRQILESQQLGVIDPGIPLRFLYYVSDLPLERGADLSTQLRPDEGVPPLYAITRHILSRIFKQGTH